MIPIAFLLFMGATCQQISSVPNQEINKLKNYIIAKQPNKVATELEAAAFYADAYAGAKTEKPLPDSNLKTICGCPAQEMFSIAYIFRNTPGKKPTIDFIPIAESEPIYGDIQIQKTTIATKTFTWKWEQAIEVGAEIEFSTGPFGIGAKSKATFKSVSKGGEDRTTTETEQLATTNWFKCPLGHRCQLSTWTFTAEYEGDFYEMPVANFKCLPRSVKWVYKSGQARELDESSKMALATLVGKEDSWDHVTQQYCTLRNRTSGQDISQIPSGGSDVLGIEFPPDSVEIISKNLAKGDPPKFPLLNDNREPYRVTVLLSYSVEGDNKTGKQKRNILDEDLDSEDVKLEIFVVDTNIPGHKIDTVLPDGTVVRAE